jgi:rod shape determining protein RodA
MNRVRLTDIEWGVIIPALLLFAISFDMILAVSGWQRALSQLAWIGLSGVVSLVVLALDYNSLSRASVVIYSVTILALVLVLFTPPINGARSWFLFGGMSLQPAEFCKPALILLLAAYLPYRDFYKSFPGLLPPLFFTLIPIALIVLQPDLGTAILFIPIFIVVVVVAGVRMKHLLMLLLLAVVLAPLIYPMLADHQKKRLHAFIQPQKYKKSVNLHLEQARIAIGAGGLTGYESEEEGSEPHQVFRIYAATDYAFAVVGERYGFLGTAFLILLYIWMLLTMFMMLMRIRDPIARLLISGVMAVLAFQAFTHIGGNLNLIPFTGVPLPLVSSGGSSVMAFSICLALVLNVGLRRKMVFSDDREANRESEL